MEGGSEIMAFETRSISGMEEANLCKSLGVIGLFQDIGKHEGERLDVWGRWSSALRLGKRWFSAI